MTYSPVYFAARYGIHIGGMLSLLAVASLLSQTSIIASIFEYIMMFVILFNVLMQLRAVYTLSNETLRVGDMWLQGFLTFVFGSLISSLVAYIVLTFFMPTFIYDSVMRLLEVYDQMKQPEIQQMAEVLRKATDAGALPTNIQICVTMFFFTTFLGSLCSLMVSLLIRFVLKGFEHKNIQKNAQ